MDCPSCGHPNRSGAHFCAECATPLLAPHTCPSCGAHHSASEKFCDECGSSLTASPQPEKVQDVANRARGRAQAGDRPVRRREGLDGARRAARPRGVAADHGPLLRDPLRGRPPLRGHGQPVHRRRHHGAVRRADRARGPRAARVLRGAPSAATSSPLRGGAAARRRGSASRCAWASTRARSWSARSATTCAWTTPRTATPSASRSGWSSSPSRTRVYLTRAHGGAGGGLLRARPISASSRSRASSGAAAASTS